MSGGVRDIIGCYTFQLSYIFIIKCEYEAISTYFIGSKII